MEQSTPEISVKIAQGERPSSPYEDDYTVSCFDNPYPHRCRKYNRTTLDKRREYQTPYENLERPFNKTSFDEDYDHDDQINSTRLFCTDFRNNSDNGLLWWQKLRRTAATLPLLATVLIDTDHDDCKKNEQYINFYVKKNSNSKLQYVDLQRSPGLAKKGSLNLILCYTAKETPNHHNIIDVGYSFRHCLRNYGKKYRGTNITNPVD